MSAFFGRNFSRRSVLRSASVAGAVSALPLGAALLAGCGDDNSPSKSTTAASPSAAGSPAAAAIPKRGGSFRFRDWYGGATDLPTLDNYANQGAIVGEALSYTNPSLVNYRIRDSSKGLNAGTNDYSLEPWMAKSLPEQPDKVTLVFKLQDGVKYENKPPANGRAVTAADFVYNYQKTTQAPGATIQQEVDKFEAVDDQTIRVTLKSPSASIIGTIARISSFCKEVEESADKDTVTMSSGPWRITDVQRGSGVKYDRNPNYWEKDLPYLDKLERVVIADASTAQASFRSGDLEGVYADRRDIVDSLTKAVPGSQYQQASNHSNYNFGMDLTLPQFKDQRVRQAVSMAFDRDQMLRIYGGEGTWNTHVGALYEWAQDPKQQKAYQLNIAEAKKLLSAAGFDKLGSLTLFMTQFLRGASAVQEAELMKAQLEANLGANITIKELQRAELYSTVILTPTYTGVAISQTLQANDPDEYYKRYYNGSAPAEIVKGMHDLVSKDTELLGLVKQEHEEYDVPKRMALSKQITTVLTDRMWTVPFVLPPIYWVTAPQIHSSWSYHYYPGMWARKAWTTKA